MLPLIEDFARWRGRRATLLPTEPLTTAIRYDDNHRDALFRFVDDPDVPIDDSPTEREFQNVAKLRLAMLFAGSTEDVARACVLLGIVAMCRAQAVPLERLSRVGRRAPPHAPRRVGLSFEDLTPPNSRRRSANTAVTLKQRARPRRERIPVSLVATLRHTARGRAMIDGEAPR